MCKLRNKCFTAARAVIFLAVAGLSTGLVSAETRYVLETSADAVVLGLASRYGFDIISTSRNSEGYLYTIRTADPLPSAAIQALRAEYGIREVELSRVFDEAESKATKVSPAALDTPPPGWTARTAANYYGSAVLASYTAQRAGQIVRLSEAQQSFGGGGGVVAIIDTGVDTFHPALQGVLLPGYDFTQDRPDTVSEVASAVTRSPLSQSTVEILDSRFFAVTLEQSTVEILDQSTVEILDGTLPKAFGHGTMVAGLVHLVAPNARILPLKAFQPDGSASLYDVARAIRYAADYGATVINLSMSYTPDSPVVRSAVAYAQAKGAACIASSGNLGKEIKVYPAAYPGVIGVGSVNSSDRRSPFSNYGDSTDTSAPGEALITLYPGGNYAAVWGTSFSTALVSGATALVRSVSPRMRANELKDAFEHGVVIRQEMGDARLDLVQLLTHALNH